MGVGRNSRKTLIGSYERVVCMHAFHVGVYRFYVGMYVPCQCVYVLGVIHVGVYKSASDPHVCSCSLHVPCLCVMCACVLVCAGSFVFHVCVLILC